MPPPRRGRTRRLALFPSEEGSTIGNPCSPGARSRDRKGVRHPRDPNGNRVDDTADPSHHIDDAPNRRFGSFLVKYLRVHVASGDASIRSDLERRSSPRPQVAMNGAADAFEGCQRCFIPFRSALLTDRFGFQPSTTGERKRRVHEAEMTTWT